MTAEKWSPLANELRTSWTEDSERSTTKPLLCITGMRWQISSPTCRIFAALIAHPTITQSIPCFFAGGDYKKDALHLPAKVVTLLLMRLPNAIPEIPVNNIQTAAAYYVSVLGFHLDWHSESFGIAGISQDDCRMFLTDAGYRQGQGNNAPVLIWLNLENRRQVDELHHRWREAGAKILSAPEDKPWNLHEFTAADLDGNRMRVFYDFTWEAAKEGSASPP